MLVHDIYVPQKFVLTFVFIWYYHNNYPPTMFTLSTLVGAIESDEA